MCLDWYVFYFLVVIIVISCLFVAEAAKNWRNLRKRYTSAKKKFRSVNKSGTSSNKVTKAKTNLDKYQFLKWLDPHITQRNTQTNIPVDDGDTEEDEEFEDSGASENDDDDVDTEDIDDHTEKTEMLNPDESNPADITNDSLSAPEQNTSAISVTSVSATNVADEMFDISASEFVSNRKAEKKAEKKGLHLKPKSRMAKAQRFELSRNIEKEELGLLRSLTKKMEEPAAPTNDVDIKRSRDEWDMFGELLATKLRKMSPDIREDAEMALNNTLMEYIVKDRHARTSALRPLHQSPPQQYHQAISPIYPYSTPNPQPYQPRQSLMRHSVSSTRTGSPYLDSESSAEVPSNPISGAMYTIMGSTLEKEN